MEEAVAKMQVKQHHLLNLNCYHQAVVAAGEVEVQLVRRPPTLFLRMMQQYLMMHQTKEFWVLHFSIKVD